MILDKTFDFLKTSHKSLIDELTIDEFRCGTHMSAVKLSDNSYGVVSTLLDEGHQCVKGVRDFGDFTPAKISGQPVLNLLETKKSSGLISTLKVAVLNAISSTIISKGEYKVIENADPIDMIDLNSNKNITMVGAFNTYIRRIPAETNNLQVLELNESALAQGFEKYYVPADEYKNVLPKSDIVIITGLTLVNSTIDNLLNAISPGTQVIVTGPSSSLVPDILFQNKVNIIGSTRIVNPELLFQLISEMGKPFHIFKYCAQKICIMNE
ncbi:MAG TPA: DUF364 domain-containing protein [Perlabentimonas sp.]|nr:DUF364 domain-containing protein [Bacteroidales bacterium]MDD4671517.1 DUF364 domain-containing protein [Bacteroidales bacterium]MDY0348269.1 DUF364 domain-containing protein [Tenuifilaceae bacterium]HZJ74545.1 DUF364 domain-containing protein [Perlabentimonas sp.]